MSRPFDPGNRPWTSADCAEYLGMSTRAFSDLTRDPDAPVPPPFGRAGNSQLWDPGQFMVGAKKLRAWLADAGERSTHKRLATLKAQEDQLAERQARFEAQRKYGLEQQEMWAANAARRQREFDALAAKSGRGSS